MDRNRRNLLLGVAIAVILLAGAAFVAGFLVTESNTFVESTVVTTQSGNVTSSGESLVLVVRDGGDFANRLEDRLESRLAEAGYAVAVAQRVEGHQGPLLVVDVEETDINAGFARHSAELTVESYYATEWNATRFEEFQETGVVEQPSPDEAVVVGEYVIGDQTRDFTTQYRSYLADLVVEAVTENFRGNLTR